MATRKVIKITPKSSYKKTPVISSDPSCVDCCYAKIERYPEEVNTSLEDPPLCCHYNPPLVVCDENGPLTIRPIVSEFDHVCSKFKGKQ